jgi:hypothetical protein
VEDWGNQVLLTLYFYQYSDLEVSLSFERDSIHKLDNESVSSELKTDPAMQSLFNSAALQLGTLNLIGEEHKGLTVRFGVRLKLLGFHVSGERVIKVDFRGKARLISQEVLSPAVVAYGAPGDSPKGLLILGRILRFPVHEDRNSERRYGKCQYSCG